MAIGHHHEKKKKSVLVIAHVHVEDSAKEAPEDEKRTFM